MIECSLPGVCFVQVSPIKCLGQTSSILYGFCCFGGFFLHCVSFLGNKKGFQLQPNTVVTAPLRTLLMCRSKQIHRSRILWIKLGRNRRSSDVSKELFRSLWSSCPKPRRIYPDKTTSFTLEIALWTGKTYFMLLDCIKTLTYTFPELPNVSRENSWSFFMLFHQKKWPPNQYVWTSGILLTCDSILALGSRIICNMRWSVIVRIHHVRKTDTGQLLW